MIRSLLSTRTLFTAAVVAVLTICADTASAQEVASAGRPLIDLTKYFGAGLITVGAALGISRLATAAYESMARQPEVAGSISTAMLIAAALIEGFTFFALLICFLK
ncbi:MAG: ATP synthase F0 subunit C [Planctomycetia bacterium]|jgi:F-type H+-transporting ATPase subunit c